MEKYQIINIKNPENGPQVVHPSVWNDLQVLSDMGYMRYEGIDKQTEIDPITERELIEDIDNKLQELQHISQRPSKQNRVKRKYNRKK